MKIRGQPISPFMHRVARAMLRLEGWRTPTTIGRACDDYREHVSTALYVMRRARLVERRRTGHHGGYEWRLTESGNAFAISAEPAEDSGTPRKPEHDHRALSAALGMNATVVPSAGRLHLMR